METTIPVRLTDELVAWIDAAREAREPGAPTRSQLIRELLVRGLRSEGTPQPKRT
jgi:hypothetical protein